MRQAWYGPLVQLGDISAHVGCHVQLVVFILQCQPPERVRTLKGSEVMRSILYVGDSSCSHIKVSLWNNAACCHDISAGDIIFLQNMKIVEFRGEVELASAQFSEVTSLLKRQDFLPSQGVENAVDSCQHGPLVKEKFKSVTSWAHQTQWNLISLLNRVSSVIFLKERVKSVNGLPCKNVDMRGQREWTTASEEQVRKCSSIVEATSIQEHCVVEFSAAIGEMFLPCMTNSMYLSLNHDGCLLFSKHLHGKAARGLLRELLCIGCETCGRALEKDSNGVYAGCRCGLISPFGASDVQRAKQKQAGRIFRPFYLHVGDQSGQMTLLVTHAAAVHMFASISADNVFRSLQGDSTMDFSHQTKQDVHSRANDVNKLVMNRIDHGLVLILLIRCLLSSKNSPFRFRAICHPYMRGSLEHLNLLSVGLPMIN